MNEDPKELASTLAEDKDATMTYYTLSYDNFYMSSDITTLESIDRLIDRHIELDRIGEYSALFVCNSPSEYLSRELIKVNDSNYTLRLHFEDDDTRDISLHRCTIY